MDNFFQFFALGLSIGFASAFAFFFVGRTIRKAFGLIGRSALMR